MNGDQGGEEYLGFALEQECRWRRRDVWGERAEDERLRTGGEMERVRESERGRESE